MRNLRALGTLVAATALVVAAGAPAHAARKPRLLHAQLSVSAVTGTLRPGAGITVIAYCPRGARLDQAKTKRAGEAHDPRLRLINREYWPAASVVRYRVTTKIKRHEPVLAVTAALCTKSTRRDARTVTGKAKVDLRVWGPAPARLELINTALVVVADNRLNSGIFRTTMQAAGVDRHPQSLRHAVTAMQTSLSNPDGSEPDGIDAVIAVGQTHRAVPRGRFLSMRNTYRYTAHLDQPL